MSLAELRAEIAATDAATARLHKALEDLVAREIERGAALYVREKHLPALMGACWLDMSDEEILDELERKARAAAQMLAAGHWAGDINRVIALKQALAGERCR
jgi:hypothetical protein